MAVVSKLEIFKEENLFNYKVMNIKVHFIFIAIAFFFTSFQVMNLWPIVKNTGYLDIISKACLFY